MSLIKIRSDKITKSLSDLLDTIKNWCNLLFALDNNTVHKTGDESISGNKIYFPDVRLTPTETSSLVQVSEILMCNQTITLGVPSNDGDHYSQFIMTDSSNDSDERTAYMFYHHFSETANNPNPYLRVGLHHIVPGTVEKVVSQLTLGWDTRNNRAYATVPTFSDLASNGDNIATTKWVRTATGNTTLNAANVTGTVAIANGGTGATDRVNAVKSLFNSNVGSTLTHVLGIKSTTESPWNTAGYVDISSLKTGLGLGTAAYTASTDYLKTSGTQDKSGDIYFTVGNPNIKRSSLTYGTTPSSNVYMCYGFYDKDTTRVGGVEYCARNSGNVDAKLFANARQTDKWASVSVCAYDGTTDNRAFFPDGNGAMNLGDSSHKWKQLYASTTTISTSDERLKTNISSMDDILNVWEEIQFSKFQFKDAVKEKGKDARYHTGVIAQQIKKIFEKYNLDPNKYAFFCHDSWNAEPAEYDENGNILSSEILAGDAYSIRYEEVLCIEAAYLRKKNRQLEATIQSLVERIEKLENK